MSSVDYSYCFDGDDEGDSVDLTEDRLCSFIMSVLNNADQIEGMTPTQGRSPERTYNQETSTHSSDDSFTNIASRNQLPLYRNFSVESSCVELYGFEGKESSVDYRGISLLNTQSSTESFTSHRPLHKLYKMINTPTDSWEGTMSSLDHKTPSHMLQKLVNIDESSVSPCSCEYENFVDPSQKKSPEESTSQKPTTSGYIEADNTILQKQGDKEQTTIDLLYDKGSQCYEKIANFTPEVLEENPVIDNIESGHVYEMQEDLFHSIDSKQICREAIQDLQQKKVDTELQLVKHVLYRVEEDNEELKDKVEHLDEEVKNLSCINRPLEEHLLIEQPAQQIDSEQICREAIQDLQQKKVDTELQLVKHVLYKVEEENEELKDKVEHLDEEVKNLSCINRPLEEHLLIEQPAQQSELKSETLKTVQDNVTEMQADKRSLELLLEEVKCLHDAESYVRKMPEQNVKSFHSEADEASKQKTRLKEGESQVKPPTDCVQQILSTPTTSPQLQKKTPTDHVPMLSPQSPLSSPQLQKKSPIDHMPMVSTQSPELQKKSPIDHMPMVSPQSPQLQKKSPTDIMPMLSPQSPQLQKKSPTDHLPMLSPQSPQLQKKSPTDHLPMLSPRSPQLQKKSPTDIMPMLSLQSPQLQKKSPTDHLPMLSPRSPQLQKKSPTDHLPMLSPRSPQLQKKSPTDHKLQDALPTDCVQKILSTPSPATSPQFEKKQPELSPQSLNETGTSKLEKINMPQKFKVLPPIGSQKETIDTKQERINMLLSEVKKLQQALCTRKELAQMKFQKMSVDLKRKIEEDQQKLTHHVQLLSVKLEQTKAELTKRNKENIRLHHKLVEQQQQESHSLRQSYESRHRPTEDRDSNFSTRPDVMKCIRDLNREISTERTLHNITKRSLHNAQEEAAELHAKLLVMRHRPPSPSPAEPEKTRIEKINELILRSQIRAQMLRDSSNNNINAHQKCVADTQSDGIQIEQDTSQSSGSSLSDNGSVY